LNSGEYSKIMYFIAIDEYVNFGKYYANEESNKDDVFELQSIIFHSGESIFCGHYTALVKCNDSWKYFDDQKELMVKDLKNFMILNTTKTQSYMLVYTRVESNKCKNFERNIQPLINNNKKIELMFDKENEKSGKKLKKNTKIKEILSELHIFVKDRDANEATNDVEMIRSKTIESLMNVDSQSKDEFIRMYN
ncbi:unnamed protein product, partial [Brachionus calyciflorus]